MPKLADQIEVHHGSLDRNVRLEVEDRLKNGELRAVVCSTSLEMGVDIGAIDLVVMISAPKGISRTLQRIGRSGHAVDATSHGILVATNVDDLMECTVTARLARERRLDPVRVPENSADVLVQHVLGHGAGGAGHRRWTPSGKPSAARGRYRQLERADFDRVVEYLHGGGRSLEQGVRGHLRQTARGRGRRVCGPSSRKVGRDYLVNIGTIATRGVRGRACCAGGGWGRWTRGSCKGLKVGDVFVLGGRVVRLVEAGWQVAKVEAADGERPNVPMWSSGPDAAFRAGWRPRSRSCAANSTTRLGDGDGAADATGWWKNGRFRRRTRRPSSRSSGCSGGIPWCRATG